MKKIPVILSAMALLSLAGCGPGYERRQAVANAESYGADWIVTQDRSDLTVGRCWLLHDVSVANEEHSDGIHWMDSQGHLLHLSGWYNRIMVVKGDWSESAKQLGVTDISKCTHS